MPDLKEIQPLPVENELHTCQACGYERGFHTSFVSNRSKGDTAAGSQGKGFRIILICPECGARYDVGWRFSPDESESRPVNAPSRSPSCVPHGNPAACMPEPTLHDEHPKK